MKKYFKITLILVLSIMFIGCSEDDDILMSDVKIRVENYGDDMISTLKVQISNQTITLNQFESGDISDYYSLGLDNMNSSLVVIIENSLGESQSAEVLLTGIGHYTIKVLATPDFSAFDVSILHS